MWPHMWGWPLCSLHSPISGVNPTCGAVYALIDRRGREPRNRDDQMPRAPSDTVDLKVRMREPLRAALEKAASETGGSMNAEAVRRLEASFERSNLHREVLSLMYGSQLGGLLMMIGSTLHDVGPHAAFSSTHTLEGSQRWLDDPYAFDQAVNAVNGILEALRPPGEPMVPPSLTSLGQIDPALGRSAADMGRGFASAMVSAVAGAGRPSHAPSLQLQNDGAEIADMLGSVAKRLASGTKRRSDAR